MSRQNLESAPSPSPSTKAQSADLKSRPVLPVRAAVLGASGYVGRELLALLARHPDARVVRLISSASGGKKPFPIEQAHPALRGRFRDSLPAP